MRMLNGDISGLYSFLMDRKLPISKSRLRMRFCNILKQKFLELEEEKKLCASDEDIIQMMSEEFVLDNTEERKDLLLLVKEIIETTDDSVELNGAGQIIFDRYCLIAESIQYED